MSRTATSLLAMLCLTSCMSFHRGPLPGEPTGTYHDFGDVRVRYKVSGQGPVVVLVHGFASSLNVWNRVAPELEQHFTVVRLDLKGFGWTDRPEGDYSPKAQADLVFRLMDQLGVPKAAVVAHSWGTSIALRMALEQPKRVTKLAVYDGWAYADQLPSFFIWARAEGLGEAMFAAYYKERADDRMAMAFHDPKYVTQELIEEVEANLDRPGTVRAALQASRDQRFEEIEHRYREVTQPTLLMWGRNDRVSPPSVGERLARELPDAELITFGACGHFPMIEAFGPSTRALVRFLLETRPDPGAPR